MTEVTEKVLLSLVEFIHDYALEFTDLFITFDQAVQYTPQITLACLVKLGA